VRWTVVLLLLLLVIAEEFGLDVVLGAFLAGIVLRRWAPGDVHALEGKLDAIGYGFFIPVFFAASGRGLDIRSIAEAPLRLLVFFVLLLVVRGVPSLFLYRSGASSIWSDPVGSRRIVWMIKWMIKGGRQLDEPGRVERKIWRLVLYSQDGS
jgi:Kef-type K+ transport system membrane component KefB